MNTDTLTAVITGGSSGIGLSTAIALKDKGYNVFELSRRDFFFEGITHIKCDVTDEQSVKSSIEYVISRTGAIDLLITCAGYGIAGAIEFTNLEDSKNQLDVNFFGTVNSIKAVIPFMRERLQGKIICLSSVAGAISIPFQAYYSVSKAAINSYVRALANEVKPFNIKVCAIMPGDIHTPFTSARKTSLKGDDLYNNRIGRSISTMEQDELNGTSSKKAADFIVSTAAKKSFKPIYVMGFKYKLFVLLSKIMPERTVSAIVSSLYAK